MATPARNLGFYLLWLAMLGVLSIMWPRGTDHSSPFAGMGPGIERAILIGCAALILFKVSAAALWRLARAPQTAEAEAQPGKPTDPGLALAAATGAFAAHWSMFVRKLLNWSHRHGEFRNDVLNATIKPPAIVCQPAQGFARKLPVFRAAQAR
jgi:hypothetical protein